MTVTLASAIAIASILIAIGGIVFNAGRTQEKVKTAQETAKGYSDGLGRKVRELEDNTDSRFQAITALLVEWAKDDPAKVHQVAEFIRKD